jgi:DNA-binding GntR family transcriptional regulator
MSRKKESNLVRQAYEGLKKAIICMRYLPGENLLEEELEQALNVSRTPIRIALSKLEHEGLVTHRPGRGYLVREIRLKDVRDLFQVREYLEVPATRLAAENAAKEELADLRDFWARTHEALERSDFEGYLNGAVEFHYRIAMMSRNDVLCELIKSLNERLSIVSRILLRSERRLARSHQEHKGILDRIVDRDADAAAEAARRHVIESQEEFLDLLRSRTELLAVSPLPGFEKAARIQKA